MVATEMATTEIAKTEGRAQPVTWVITDGKIGMEKQCLAIAAALNVSPVVKRLSIRAPWRWLPPQLWFAPLRAMAKERGVRSLAPPWPDLIIATGRQSVAPVQAIRKSAGGTPFCVQLQNPGISPERFDLVVAPAHDQMAGSNILSTLGAVHDVNPTSLINAHARFSDYLAGLPRPLVTIVLGGPNGVYEFPADHAERLGNQLSGLARAHGLGIAVTASRRTPPAVVEALRRSLEGLPALIWDANDDEADPNPYLGILAHADWILVTGDSVNMVSEAAGTGKPVYVIDLPGGSEKFKRFHDGMRKAKVTRSFTGRLDMWSYEVPNDTDMVATQIRHMLAQRNP
jgi:mitochondrial fission protein ELM1